MLNFMMRSLLTHAGRGENGARLSIFFFHRVLARADPLFPDLPDAERFSRQMSWLSDWFQVLPLLEAVDRMERGGLPPRAAAITFDDGYADNAEVALPVLQRLGLPATFFVSSGFLDGTCMWNDLVIEALRACRSPQIDLTGVGLGRIVLGEVQGRRPVIERTLAAIKHRAPDERARCVNLIVDAAGVQMARGLMMTAEQVRQLHAGGMSIGGHTVSHPILTRLAPAEAHREIARGKDDLEQIIGEPVPVFAYPNGVPKQDYDAGHVELVRRCGFTAAVTTAWGAAMRGADCFQLPRFTPWDRDAVRFGLRVAANLRRPRFETLTSA